MALPQSAILPPVGEARHGFLLLPVQGIEVVERAIMPEEFAKATEVTPVGEIDHHRFTPGDITKTMVQDYEKATGQTGKEAE